MYTSFLITYLNVQFRLDSQAKVWVFPEGTRKLCKTEPVSEKHGYLLPFKKGAFNLAVHAQVSHVTGLELGS